MRVLFVTDALNNGGAERQLTLLVSSLLPSHSVTVLSLGDGPFCDALRELGAPVEVFPRRYRYDVFPAIKMWRAASAFGPDIVHSWGRMASWAMLPFCRGARVPLLGVVRDASPSNGRPRGRSSAVAISHLVVANSHAGLDSNHIGEARGRVVYNGFDESRFASIARTIGPSRFPAVARVVMTARMSPQKDWQTLLRVARRLATAEKGRWEFIAVGNGPDRDGLMLESADLVAEGVLAFPQGGTEVLPIVARADIGVLLTNTRIHAEGCSNSIMEYMACGLPVVCTDCGGNSEVVEAGRTGYLVPPSDDDALEARLRELRDDPLRARAMGDAGAGRLREEFSVQAMLDGYLAAYAWALSVSAGRAARPNDT
jgi:glycosyltransferase involved in cell wall biosynthesis